MGNYISEDQLRNHIGQNTTDNLIDFVDDTEQFLEDLILEAEALIDGYLGKVYKVPVPSSNNLVKRWTKVFAERKMYIRGPFNDIPAKLKDQYAEVLLQLQDVINGHIVIQGASLVSENGSSIDVESNTPLMTADALVGF